jgi:hypothetical protein
MKLEMAELRRVSICNLFDAAWQEPEIVDGRDSTFKGPGVSRGKHGTPFVSSDGCRDVAGR